MALHQQFRVFVYDPAEDQGAYRPVCDLWATSEKDALLTLQSQTSRDMKLSEAGTFVAMNADTVQFIARSHADKDRWPNVETGMLPHSDNAAKREDFARGRL